MTMVHIGIDGIDFMLAPNKNAINSLFAEDTFECYRNKKKATKSNLFVRFVPLFRGLRWSEPWDLSFREQLITNLNGVVESPPRQFYCAESCSIDDELQHIPVRASSIPQEIVECPYR